MNKDLNSEEIIFGLWSIAWISTYWYHNEIERKIHVQYFMERFVRAQVYSEYKRELLHFIFEVVKTFGKPDQIIQTLTFMINILRTKREQLIDIVDWKLLAVWQNALKNIRQGKNYNFKDIPIEFYEKLNKREAPEPIQ